MRWSDQASRTYFISFRTKLYLIQFGAKQKIKKMNQLYFQKIERSQRDDIVFSYKIGFQVALKESSLQSYLKQIRKIKMNPDNSHGLQHENSQSFKYSLLDMNFDTNFEHINEGQGGNSLQSTFYLSLQQNNNLVFNNLKKEAGKPLLLEFPPFSKQKEKQQPSVSSTNLNKARAKSNSKVKKSKDIPKKGLREISQQVKELVCGRNGLTYNQVAQFVIDDNKQSQELQQQLGKSATVNIKRRVYDVLAVLSSLKLLQRDSKKKIFATNQCYKIGVGTCKNKQKLQELSQSIFSVKDSIREKEELLRKSLTQYTKLRQLSERNIGLIQHQNNLREKQIDRYLGSCEEVFLQDLDVNLQKTINFPFVYTVVDDEDNVFLEHSQSSSCLTLQNWNKEINGDLDLIMKLDLPECPKDNLQREVQSSLLKVQHKK